MSEVPTPSHLKVVEIRARVHDPNARVGETAIDAGEFLSEEFTDALNDVETHRQVDQDVSRLVERLFVNPAVNYKQPSIELSVINKDHEGLSIYRSQDNDIVYVPGLMGLDEIDKAGDHYEDKRTLVRLYCGVMLAHKMVQGRFAHEHFFRVVMKKSFPLPKASNIDTFSALTMEDPQIQNRHREITFARFAAGAALAALFDDDEQTDMLEVLRNKYESDMEEMILTASTTADLLIWSSQRDPDDLYPTLSKGFANPVGAQQVETVLMGRLSKR